MQSISDSALTNTSVPTVENRVINNSSAATANVDFENFLQLLTAQLRNQDPLSPLDSTQFVAQLASFSSVEQLVSVNDRLDTIASSLVGDAIDRYAPWIGKEAEIADASFNFNGEPIRFRVAGFSDASHVEAQVVDASGNEVTRFPIRNEGEIQTWDGIVSDKTIGSGAYRLNAVYYDSDGSILRTEPASYFARISEVRLTGDGAEIRLADGGSASTDQIVGLSDAPDQ